MEAVQKTPEREAFYKKIDDENLPALWNVMNDLITPEPRSACRPHLWKFNSIRDYMTEAGRADHRQGSRTAGAGAGKPGPARPIENHDVVVCRRADGGPGDVAPAHRHSQSALRFVLEGKGAEPPWTASATLMEPAISSSPPR